MFRGPTITLICFFLFVLAITKVLSDNWTKRRLIEARLPEDVVRALFRKETDPELFGALKWGIVLWSVGLALVVTHYLRARFDQPLTWGVVLLFGGGGLMAYYITARAVLRRDPPDTAAGREHERYRDGLD